MSGTNNSENKNKQKESQKSVIDPNPDLDPDLKYRSGTLVLVAVAHQGGVAVAQRATISGAPPVRH
jgi:hypothetical protein